ncbi:MAG: bifunctional DNA primase/polymerase, partial [Candidatus Rokubacteria bacterium]|nr:bifunctional DNA primase/polymerase [Candidatus Rokubacteria bacterium]
MSMTQPSETPVPALCAFAYLRFARWSVVPIKTGENRPLIEWQPFQLRHPTEEEVRDWFTRWPEANVGIVTGAVSGLVVLDIDSVEGLRAVAERCGGTLPVTPIVRTPRGWHVYLQHSGERTIPNKIGLLPGVDLRGDGGYVVAPGSVGENGELYRFVVTPLSAAVARQTTGETAFLAPIPQWVLGLSGEGAPKGDLPTSGSVSRQDSIPPLKGPLKGEVWKETNFRPLTAADLLAHESEPIIWVWEPYLPEGGLALLAAFMKVGKSTFVYALAVTVAQGQPFL